MTFVPVNGLAPIEVGTRWSFFGCLGDSKASCFWFGARAGHRCTKQCPNCGNCNAIYYGS